LSLDDAGDFPSESPVNGEELWKIGGRRELLKCCELTFGLRYRLSARLALSAVLQARAQGASDYC
jgi:hypothetical protein